MKYQVLAYPLTRHTTGERVFCADDSGVVKAEKSGSPQDCIENGSNLY